MRILNNLAIFFYTVICLATGFFLILLSLNTIPITKLELMLEFVYTESDVRLVLGGIGAAIILIGLLIAHLVSGKLRREKTIAFENPDGQVTVSLSAIEDLIKRVSRQMPDIKDLRPNVIASKKGITIINRVVLYAGANIPEVTEKIQNIIKGKIQEMLGIEEPIIVRVHISKIGSRDTKQKEVIEEVPHVFKGIEYSED